MTDRTHSSTLDISNAFCHAVRAQGLNPNSYQIRDLSAVADDDGAVWWEGDVYEGDALVGDIVAADYAPEGIELSWYSN